MKSIKTLALLLCITIGLIKVSIAQNDLAFTVNGVSFVMKPVEGGSFRMGGQDGETISFEKPVHNVTLSDFYLGETEVTQALWLAVMGTTVSQQRDKMMNYIIPITWPLVGEGDDYPIYIVSWDECQEFISKLNLLTGKNFRLPTEAEWEYAARGGKKGNGYKYAGSNILEDVAWYHDNSGNRIHIVKKKAPNELGLYDMCGNVWEWCQDWWDSEYYSKSSSINPQGPSSGVLRVLRGGCYCGVKECRISFRFIYGPDLGLGDGGFRLCLPNNVLN